MIYLYFNYSETLSGQRNKQDDFEVMIIKVLGSYVILLNVTENENFRFRS